MSLAKASRTTPWARVLVCASLVAALLTVIPTLADEGDRSGVEEFPAPVRDVLYVRPFTLAEGYRFTWSHEPRVIKSGVIVVLRVDPELVLPRNAPEPILYAGERTVEKLNTGYPSGRVIALVPGDFDPTTEPVWFGRPGLPARATPESIESEVASAQDRIHAFSAKRMADVTRPPMEAPDMASLLRGEIAELVLRYAPEESHLARKWRLPEAKAKPDSVRPRPEEPEGGPQ